MFCAEVNHLENEPFITAIIHFYRFSFDEENQYDFYKNLCTSLGENGYTLFDAISLNGYKAMQEFKKHDGETIKLYNPETWDNQYTSDLGRVFKWYEEIYPNKRVKEGYYLEFITA